MTRMFEREGLRLPPSILMTVVASFFLGFVVGAVLTLISSGTMATLAVTARSLGLPIILAPIAFCLNPIGSVTVAANVIFTTMSLVGISFLKLFVPTSLATAAYNAAPVTATIAPGVMAAAAVQYMKYRTDVVPNLTGRSSNVLGATGALLLGLRSGSFLPGFAAALSAPVSGAYLLATSAVITAGTMASDLLFNESPAAETTIRPIIEVN